MRILFTCVADFRAPSEKQVLSYAGHLLAGGHEVMVALGGDPATADAEGAPDGLVVTNYRFAGPRLAGPAFAAARRFRPEVVHAFSPRLGPMRCAARLAGETGAPLLVHFEDDEWSLMSWRAGDRLIRNAGRMGIKRVAGLWPSAWPYATASSLRKVQRAAAGLDAIIPSLAHHVETRLGRPCATLLPPLDPPGDDRMPEEAPARRGGEGVVVYTGNVFGPHEADFRLLLLALGTLKQRGRGVRLLHAGTIMARFDMAREARQAGLDAGDVELLGYLPSSAMPAVLGSGDVLVQPGHPSRFNHLRLPSKMQRYLSSGTPTVTFGVGLGELLEDRTEVLKTHTGDPGELADRIAEILDDESLAAALRAGGPAAARRLFDGRRNTETLLEHYRAVLAR